MRVYVHAHVLYVHAHVLRMCVCVCCDGTGGTCEKCTTKKVHGSFVKRAYTRALTSANRRMRMCACVHVHVCIYVHMCTCVHVYVHVHVMHVLTSANRTVRVEYRADEPSHAWLSISDAAPALDIPIERELTVQQALPDAIGVVDGVSILQIT